MDVQFTESFLLADLEARFSRRQNESQLGDFVRWLLWVSNTRLAEFAKMVRSTASWLTKKLEHGQDLGQMAPSLSVAIHEITGVRFSSDSIRELAGQPATDDEGNASWHAFACLVREQVGT